MRPARTCGRCRCPARRCCGRWPRLGSGRGLQLVRPESVETAAAALGNGSVALAGGTHRVPPLPDRLVPAETPVELEGVVPARIEGAKNWGGASPAQPVVRA